MRHLFGTINRNKIITGYQYSATGVFGYEFYRKKRKICAVTSVCANPSVYIRTLKKSWFSLFYTDNIILPGFVRYVVDMKSNQREICRIIYQKCGFEVLLGKEKYNVTVNDDNYKFTLNGKQIAVINRITSQDVDIPDIVNDINYDWKAWYSVEISKNVSSDVLLAILAFPMLKFGEVNNYPDGKEYRKESAIHNLFGENKDNSSLITSKQLKNAGRNPNGGMYFPLDDHRLFFLTAYDDGHYSIDVEKANDSHYDLEAHEMEILAEILKAKYSRKTLLDNLKEYFKENGELNFVAMMRDNEISFREFHFDYY